MSFRQLGLAGVTIFVSVVHFSASALAAPLHEAARSGDAPAVEALLAEGASAETPDQAGEPPLLIAALEGRAEVVRLLLAKGAAIDARNKGGLTALHAAAYGGHLQIVRDLIAAGADVNDQQNFYKMAPLHAAAEENRKDVVALLLAEGAEIEAVERNGYSPLTQAGWRSYWDVVGILKHAGAVCQPKALVGDWLYGECSTRF